MRDPALEQWLDSQGIRWEFIANHSWADIAVDDEISRQIRLDRGTDPDKVWEYATAMEHGTDFPAVCVVGDGTPRPLVTGMHRKEAAALANRLTTDVYRLLTDDPLVIERVRRAANIINGRDQNREDRIEQALHLCRALGYTAKQSAETLALPYSVVENHLRADEVRRELVQVVDPRLISKLNRQQLLDLHKIPRMKHRVRLAELIAKVAVPLVEREHAISEIRDAETDADADAVLILLEKQHERRQARTAGQKFTGPRSPYQQLPGLLLRVGKLIGRNGSSPRLSKDERNEIIIQCRQTGEGLLAFASRIEDESQRARP